MVSAHGKMIHADQKMPLNDQVWHHVAMVYPGQGDTLKDVRFYIDGKSVPSVLEGSDTKIDISVFSGICAGTLHARNANPYRGSLDDLRLWVSALTEAEIVRLYQEPFQSFIEGNRL